MSLRTYGTITIYLLYRENRTIEIVIPHSNESQDDRQIILQRRLFEMLIHAVCTFEQLLEIIVSDNQSDGKTDSTPQAISSTNPIPELEHVLFGNTKLGDGGGIG